MRKSLLFALSCLAVGCSSVETNGLLVDYAFDPLEFNGAFADDHMLMGAAVPTVQCSTSSDCTVPGASPTQLSCDAAACTGTAEVRLPLAVDLSSATLPTQVVQLGVSAVTVKKIAYWIKSDTVNVALPKIDIYVASSAAKDEHDSTAVLVGSVTPLSARATACSGSSDHAGDTSAGSSPVCDVTLTSAGSSALAQFCKDYQQSFQFIVHTELSAKAGDAIPSGGIDFLLRPTVIFTVLR